jgi:hypothetical protein
MDEEKVVGICRLCTDYKELKNSHVWSQFLYRHFVCDRNDPRNRGGKLLGTFDGEDKDSKQIRRYWLCHDCEQRFSTYETKATELLLAATKNPAKFYIYDEEFFRFIVSISWRAMYLRLENNIRDLIEFDFPASRSWRLYLDEKTNDQGPFTHHAFVIEKGPHDRHGILSCNFSTCMQFFITFAGPLHIVSRLTPPIHNRTDAAIWERSRIRQEGGQIGLNKDPSADATAELNRVLSTHYHEVQDIAIRLHHLDSRKTPRPKRR